MTTSSEVSTNDEMFMTDWSSPGSPLSSVITAVMPAALR
jgi:hypothetical protein